MLSDLNRAPLVILIVNVIMLNIHPFADQMEIVTYRLAMLDVKSEKE